MKQSPSLNKTLLDEYRSKIEQTNRVIKEVYEDLQNETNEVTIRGWNHVLDEQKEILSETKEKLESLKDYIEDSKKG
tara:strand:- start:608 stop:838 length:231 start_codon:yes stop_codon:yes gene_type:complete